MTMEGSERRGSCRYELANVIEYEVSGKGGISDQLRGVTLNTSSTGLCLYVFDRLGVSERISIVKSMLPLGHHTASVRWVSRLAPDFYKIGIMYNMDEA